MVGTSESSEAIMRLLEVGLAVALIGVRVLEAVRLLVRVMVGLLVRVVWEEWVMRGLFIRLLMRSFIRLLMRIVRSTIGLLVRLTVASIMRSGVISLRVIMLRFNLLMSVSALQMVEVERLRLLNSTIARLVSHWSISTVRVA